MEAALVHSASAGTARPVRWMTGAEARAGRVISAPFFEKSAADGRVFPGSSHKGKIKAIVFYAPFRLRWRQEL
jgi:hypothetical protein